MWLYLNWWFLPNLNLYRLVQLEKKIKPSNCWGVSCLAKDPYTSSHISSKSSIGLALIEVQQDPTFSVCRNTMPALSNSMISGVQCSVEKKPKDVWQKGYPAKKRTYKSSLLSKGMLEWMIWQFSSIDTLQKRKAHLEKTRIETMMFQLQDYDTVGFCWLNSAGDDTNDTNDTSLGNTNTTDANDDDDSQHDTTSATLHASRTCGSSHPWGAPRIDRNVEFTYCFCCTKNEKQRFLVGYSNFRYIYIWRLVIYIIYGYL